VIGYLARRLLGALITLLGTTVVVFSLVRLVPADPAVTIAGPKADPQTLAAIRRDLHLEDPLPVQYVRYLGRLVRGDLGRSYLTRRPVREAIAERVGATAALAFTSLTLAFAGGLALGTVTAGRHGSATDLGVLVGSMVVLSLPVFWVGMLLLYWAGFRWQLLPLGGTGSVAHLVLPALTLAAGLLAYYARLVHANLLAVLRADFVRTARAKGLPAWQVYGRHALRNALVPVVTVLGVDFAALMSGVVLTETVFNWPGLGRLAVEAIFRLDMPVVMGTVLFSGAVVVAANLVIDLLSPVIDPRITRGDPGHRVRTRPG
jgi:ABC-type dipeptide/oligopeptide/nickel transport system permease component